jgi:hypothetical protein
MTSRGDMERCSSHGCNRPLAGNTVITAKNGRKYCKKHADRLPPYLSANHHAPKQQRRHDPQPHHAKEK